MLWTKLGISEHTQELHGNTMKQGRSKKIQGNPNPLPPPHNALNLKLFSNEKNYMETKKKTTKPQSIYEGR
jgi:hypothetical protein